MIVYVPCSNPGKIASPEPFVVLGAPAGSFESSFKISNVAPTTGLPNRPYK